LSSHCHDRHTPAPPTLSLHDALPISSTRRISSLSPWYAANASPIVTLGHGRSSTSISSPAPSSPVSITRKYAPGRPASVKRLTQDRKSTRLNSSHVKISYAVFCLKKK